MLEKYSAYPVYRAAGDDFLVDVPRNWGVKRIKTMLTLVRELVGKKAKNYQRLSLTLKGVVTKSIDDDAGKTPTKFNAYQVVCPKDIVFCLFDMDETARTVGLASQHGMITGSYNVCRCLAACDPKYAHYYFLHIDSFKGLRPFYTGLRKVVRSEVFLNLTMPIPSLLEQQQIGLFLDHEIAKIDNLIDKQQQLSKLLKEKRQAMISHVVTKGLKPAVVMRDSGIAWLGEIPQHWRVCKLKHIISSLESGVSVNAVASPARSDQLGVLKTSCVYGNSFRIAENKAVVEQEKHRLRCPLRAGAIIISRMNTPRHVGASAFVTVAPDNIFLPDRLWQTIFHDSGQQNTKFIAFFMMLKGFQQQVALAAEGASNSMQCISKENYLAIHIAMPSVEEQNEIVRYLDNKLVVIQRLDERNSDAVKLLQERRKALISAAVTGKIDVRDWKMTS